MPTPARLVTAAVILGIATGSCNGLIIAAGIVCSWWVAFAGEEEV